MKISILIPAYNEEKSIRTCIESCLNQARKFDEIVVVDDGSQDATPEILRSFGNAITVIRSEQPTGNKSYAQELGLQYITGEVFAVSDADTIINRRFAERVGQAFRDPAVAAMGGYVKSLKRNVFTTCRAFEYSIGQNLHKEAQNHLNFMLVVPGAADAFRTDVFKKHVGFDHDTLTEDLDFTYKLHEQRLKVIYDREAIVYTQDPFTLHSYINQMRRWYAGGWQNLETRVARQTTGKRI